MTGTAGPRIYPFARFYQYYLTEHRHPVCRLLHVIGSSCALLCAVLAADAGRPVLWVAVPIFGYGFAWVGHFFFEKNMPVTFRQPWFSLASDWLLWWQVVTGKASVGWSRLVTHHER